MWPAPDELTRGAPADSAAAANDILPSIELTPPETRRRDSESRGNAFSRSPKRSDSEMSDGAPTVVQVPPSQPSIDRQFTARALIHEIHTLSLNQADQMLAINMRLTKSWVHRTSSNASRRSSHTARVKTAERANLTRRVQPSSSKKRASDRRQRDPTPHDGASPAVEASRSETQVPKEQRHAGGDARRESTRHPSAPKIGKTRRRVNRWRRRLRRLGKATRVAARNRHCHKRRLSRTEENRALLGGKYEPRARRLRQGRPRRRETGHRLRPRHRLRLHRRPRHRLRAHQRRVKARLAKARPATIRPATATQSPSTQGKHHSKEKAAASKKSKHGTSKRGEPRRSDEQIMKRLQKLGK
ncbi:unnamed protein product [Trichogramma brassicae]|uniref:Uncharacterized protein n=1 Tax=Trichogramma brassicae TaxID=86971 RepID=A0A6H5HYY0_9HYME|nr:unnamed protein product [Trichogramma brassicae]